MSRRSVIAPLLILMGPAFAAAAEHVRLGTDVAPTRETIRLKLDPRSDAYSGSVEIALDVRKPSASVRLNAEEMTIARARVDGAEATTTSGPDDTIVVTPARPLAVGRATLVLEFSNEYDRRAVGLYKMDKGEDGYLFTQFEPIDARKAWPCFDEPGFKIPYQLSVEIPKVYDAVSNTPGSDGPERDGWKEVRFAPTKPLPSYLVALVVGKLEFLPVAGLGVPGRVVTVRGQAGLAHAAARVTPPLLKALETYFGTPYPYEKLDLIAIPEYWPGGMEHPGAITFADYILLIDDKAAPAQERLLVRVMAHELAHQWFGDLVTMAWWDDTWLNESFADWLGDKIAEEVRPELQVALSELQPIENAMDTDRRAAAVPIRRPVDDPNETLRSIGIIYNKGKSVLGMFERWMGPETFREGVRLYMRENAWKNATADRFWNALDRAAGRDASAALATFIEQPGLPMVTIERIGAGRVRLAQRRYAGAGVTLPEQTWKIPVAIRYSDGGPSRVETVLLDAPTREVTLPVTSLAWVFPSADGAGFYRWSVPGADLDDLATHAAQRLTPAERVAFLGNLSALLSAGHLDGGRYMQVLAPFGSDPDPEVLTSALAALEKLELPFLDDATHAGFATYVRAALGPALDRIGMEPRAGEAPGVTSVRPLLLTWLGEHGDDPRVLRFAHDAAARHLRDGGAVDPSMAATILRLHALDGNEALLAEYEKRFAGAATPAARQDYLAAAGGFRDPAVRAQALAWAVGGSLRPNEMAAMAQAFRQTPAGRDLVFEWLGTNFDAILGRVPPVFHSKLTALGGGCERPRVAKAHELFAKHDIPGAEAEMAKVSEQVDECVTLRARESARIGAYLRNRQSAP